MKLCDLHIESSNNTLYDLDIESSIATLNACDIFTACCATFHVVIVTFVWPQKATVIRLWHSLVTLGSCKNENSFSEYE